MPMPNRHIQDANGYRYAYQGQEKDPETGKEAFELRLWDGRIGRWLTTDPAGVGFSPYMGMANNPISEIDPDGACPCSECPDNCLPGDTYGYTQAPVELGTIAKAGTSMDARGFDADFPSWTSSFTGNLADWNKVSGTNFKDHYAAFDYWSNQQKQAEQQAFLDDITRRNETWKPLYMGIANLMTIGIGSGSGQLLNSLETTSTGFLGGSIAFRTPFSFKVGLYASENTIKYGTFRYATIAPRFLTKYNYFGRNFLQITEEFQPVLGKWVTQTVPKGTQIEIGLIGHQAGQGYGTWLQIYAPKGINFIK